MFGKVKKWLGIEGVKLEILLPEEDDFANNEINGKLRFMSMHEQTVTAVKLNLIERYTRGRKKDKLTDEYELGEIVMTEPFTVNAEETLEIDFSLPFKRLKSPMDENADSNILFKGIIGALKWYENVDSEFFLVAEARVEGTSLNPFDKVEISL